MKKSKVLAIVASNGERHYVFDMDNASKRAQKLDEAEARRLAKKEALKPLFIVREE